MTPEHDALLSAFLAEEKARGRRPQGLSGLHRQVPWFLRFMEERGKRAFEVTFSDANGFQREFVAGQTRNGTPYTMRTVAAYMSAAGAFCDWLARSDKILHNPFESVHQVRRESVLPAGILTEREMSALLSGLKDWGGALNLNTVTRRYRVHVIAELQYATGLRIAEVAGLEEKDVDIDRALVYVRDGKHGSNRTAFLTDYAACALELYISTARSAMANRLRTAYADRIFFTGEQQLQETVNGELKRACAEARVPVITSHGFRHALGYHLLRGGCPLRYIQAILGHKNIKDTEVYTKVDVADVKRVFDACHPRMHG